MTMIDTPDRGPLEDSPLAKWIRAWRDASARIRLQEAGYAYLTDSGLHKHEPLCTQTLRALEDWREAGEPEELGYHHIPGGYIDRSAIWPRVRSEVQKDWWMVEVVDLPGVGPNVHVDVRGWDCDLLAVAAALQAAHALAEQWRTEREAEKEAADADAPRRKTCDDCREHAGNGWLDEDGEEHSECWCPEDGDHDRYCPCEGGKENAATCPKWKP